MYFSIVFVLWIRKIETLMNDQVRCPIDFVRSYMQICWWKWPQNDIRMSKSQKSKKLTSYQRKFRKILKVFVDYNFETVQQQVILLSSRLFKGIFAFSW